MADKPAEPLAPPAPLTYEPPTLPDGIKLEPERLAAADAIFGAGQVAPEVRQQLIDYHVGEMRAYDELTLQRQHDAFAELKGNWAKQVKSDPELGGAGFRTSIERADDVLRRVLPKATEFNEFRGMLQATGVDSHPGMVRFLNRLHAILGAPASPPPDGGVPADIATRGRPGRTQLRQLYDNPRSQEVMGSGNGRG